MDELRFQPRLSLRRKDDPEDGVSGSVEVEVCAEDDSFFDTGWETGPPRDANVTSTSESSSLYSALGLDLTKPYSPLFLGRLADANGVVAVSLRFGAGIGMAEVVGLGYVVASDLRA